MTVYDLFQSHILTMQLTIPGLFNIHSKILVSLAILLEWREQMKEGFPITNIIEAKLRALLLKLEQVFLDFIYQNSTVLIFYNDENSHFHCYLWKDY